MVKKQEGGEATKEDSHSAANKIHTPSSKAIRRKKNRKNKQQAKKERQADEAQQLIEEARALQNQNKDVEDKNSTIQESEQDVDYQIEYTIQGESEILQTLASESKSSVLAEFKQIFERFDQQVQKMQQSQQENNKQMQIDEGDAETKDEDPDVKDMFSAKNSGMTKNKVAEDIPMTKKQRKLAKQMKIFDLKMQAERPDLVEAWDVTSKDPVFLLQCKQIRNTVPVSPHWAQKRRYLQYKRGIHKIAFKLPDFIENTGISKLRDKASAADAAKTLKQKMRERMQPKMGKIDIDYQVLHDAFFKHQKKSRQTEHGEVYFEGKEYEINTRAFKPGHISAALQAALGIQENCPPPWLYNMQRYGPPPSYPNLKIPGVNMLLPSEISSGSVGRMFTNDKGYTIYADCHGLNKAIYQRRQNRKQLWGALKQTEYEDFGDMASSSYESEEEEASDYLDKDGQSEEDQIQRQWHDGEMLTENEIEDVKNLVSGVKSLIQGGDSTPAEVQLIKHGAPMIEDKKSLYQVLPELSKKREDQKGQIFESRHGYVIPENPKKKI